MLEVNILASELNVAGGEQGSCLRMLLRIFGKCRRSRDRDLIIMYYLPRVARGCYEPLRAVYTVLCVHGLPP